MSTILGLILIFYCVTLLAGIAGWISATRIQVKPTVRTPKLSVIVACRNEQENVSALIQSLGNQTYPEFEVIIVDDHSTDSTLNMLKQSVGQQLRYTVLTLPADRQGKKEALTAGINHATGSIVVTTDADCVHHAEWLKSVAASFDDDEVHMLIGPVALDGGWTFFEKLQRVEYLSVISATVSSIGWHHPVMCSGANLAVRKSVFNEVAGYEGSLHIPSGDDEYLLRKVFERYPGGIQFMNQEESIVKTKLVPSLTEFLHQRWRWAGKWSANTNLLARTLGVLIVVSQAAYLASFYFARIDLWLATLIVLKFLLEFLLLQRASTFLRQRFDGVAFTILQVLYPVYVIVAGFGSIFYRPRWKGRIYN